MMIGLFEFSIKNYCSEESIFAELKNYFGDAINFFTQDVFWDVLEDSEKENRFIGLDIIDNRIKDGSEQETFVNGFSNFKETIVMLGFYKYLSKIHNTEVAFGGFTEESDAFLYLYDVNQKLYEAYISIDSRGLEIVVPRKEIKEGNIISPQQN